MNWQSVASSAVDRVAYDPRTTTLAIEFKGGRAYQYFDVPEAVYEELCAASSIGQYVTEHIKPNYRCSRLMPVGDSPR